MIKPPYYHIGIIIHDLEEAIEYYSNLLDMKFTEATDNPAMRRKSVNPTN